MQLPGQDLGPHARSEARRPGGASLTPASSALGLAEVLAKQRKKEGIVGYGTGAYDTTAVVTTGLYAAQSAYGTQPAYPAYEQ
ncbi:hypothetical protein GH733_006102 [Mirounga leonina]|nr:hypothetical protein GH733_006102 [Mirounga leonina]